MECKTADGNGRCCYPCIGNPDCTGSCCDKNCKPICKTAFNQCQADMDCCPGPGRTCKSLIVGGAEARLCCYECRPGVIADCCDENGNPWNPNCPVKCSNSGCKTTCAADGNCAVGSECCMNDDVCKKCINGLCGGVVGSVECPNGDVDCSNTVCSNGVCGYSTELINNIPCPQDGKSDCANNGQIICSLIGGGKECYQGACQAGKTNCPADYSDCDKKLINGCECKTGDGSHYCCGGTCKKAECTPIDGDCIYSSQCCQYTDMPQIICNQLSKCTPCIADTVACNQNADCCSGVCVGGKCCGGPWSCCSQEGEACQRREECCGTLQCSGGICTK